MGQVAHRGRCQQNLLPHIHHTHSQQYQAKTVQPLMGTGGASWFCHLMHTYTQMGIWVWKLIRQVRTPTSSHTLLQPHADMGPLKMSSIIHWAHS